MGVRVEIGNFTVTPYFDRNRPLLTNGDFSSIWIRFQVGDQLGTKDSLSEIPLLHLPFSGYHLFRTGKSAMEEIIMKAARELGIEEYVSVSPYSGLSPAVTVAYARGSGITVEIDARLLMEEDLTQVKIILRDMNQQAKELLAKQD